MVFRPHLGLQLIRSFFTLRMHEPGLQPACLGLKDVKGFSPQVLRSHGSYIWIASFAEILDSPGPRQRLMTVSIDLTGTTDRMASLRISLLLGLIFAACVLAQTICEFFHVPPLQCQICGYTPSAPVYCIAYNATVCRIFFSSLLIR